jgi:hypothetical protein
LPSKIKLYGTTSVVTVETLETVSRKIAHHISQKNLDVIKKKNNIQILTCCDETVTSD